MADDVSGADFSKYPSWVVVKTPSGGTYYQVPNSPWVYDPVTSQLRGRPILFRNPKPGLDERQKAIDQQDAQIKMQQQASSPLGQLVPVVGGTGAAIGGAYLANRMFNPSTAANTTQTTTNVGNQVANQVALTPSTVGSTDLGAAAPFGYGATEVPTTASGAFNAGVSGVGPIADGSGYAANIGANPGATTGVSSGLQSLGMGSGAANIAGQYVIPGIGAALGAYDIGSNLVSGQKMGTVHGALSGAGTGASVGTMILPGVGTAIGAGVGALGGALLGQFGHGKNYYHGKDRESEINQFSGGSGTLTLPTKDGSTFTVTADQFRHDPAFYNSRPGAEEFIPEANRIVGISGTEKPDVQKQQLASLFSNALHAGVSSEALQGLVGGNTSPAPQATPVVIPPARSLTSSPGIALDGGRISYMGKELAKRANARNSR